MENLINNKLIAGIGDPLIKLLILLSLVYFLYNVATYLISNDSSKQSDAKNGIIYGIIFLFVSVGVWALVNMLNLTIFGGRDFLAPGTREISPDELRTEI